MVPFLPQTLSIVINNNTLEKWRNLPVVYIRKKIYNTIVRFVDDPKIYINDVLAEAIKKLKKEQK